MHILFALLLLPFGVLHFLPTIIASLRNSRHIFGVFIINLFLGWTGIGWICALIWAITSEQKYTYVYAPPYRRF